MDGIPAQRHLANLLFASEIQRNGRTVLPRIPQGAGITVNSSTAIPMRRGNFRNACQVDTRFGRGHSIGLFADVFEFHLRHAQVFHVQNHLLFANHEAVGKLDILYRCAYRHSIRADI